MLKVKRYLLFIFFQLLTMTVVAQEFTLFVGTYTSKGSEGIYGYRFEAQTGTLTPFGVSKDLKNPSFLTLSPNKRYLYAVEENENGAVSAFRLDANGQLTKLNTQASGGAHPCYLTTDKTGRWLLVGNYSGGNFSILPILPDGSLGKATQTIQHEGKSIDAKRQDKAHVHSINIAPNNRDVFVADLGIDKLMAYTLNDTTGQLLASKTPFVSVKAGGGARHFAFHPKGKFAYLIQELDATITAFSYQKGTLTPLQSISTLPTDYTGDNSCADLHLSPDGKFLYGSNRIHDSIVVFSVNQKTGKLTLVQHEATRGKKPRNFAIDPTGNYLLVANQETDNITVFKRDKKTGKITYTNQEIKVSMPVCLLFMD